MKVGIITCAGPGGDIGWQTAFRVPNNMTEEDWRLEIVEAIRGLPEDMELDMTGYITTDQLLENVADELIGHRKHVSIVRIEAEFPWSIIKSDRDGVGRYLNRKLLERVVLQNEYIERLIRSRNERGEG